VGVIDVQFDEVEFGEEETISLIDFFLAFPPPFLQLVL
jgi:hypothetical protein